MINLIKNELIKVFSKKSIYILAIVTIIFMGLNVAIYKFSESGDLNETLVSVVEENLHNYDMKDPEELLWYVEDLSNVEMNKLASKYEQGSWQKTMVFTKAYDYIYSMNEAKYIDKDDNAYNECKNSYDEFVSKINAGDWKVFVLYEKELYEKELAMNESLLSGELEDKERLRIEKSIEKLKYSIEGVNMRLERNIAPDVSFLSSQVDRYVSSASSFVDYDKNEKNYVSRSELVAKRDIESDMYEAKYMVEHEISSKNAFDASVLVCDEFSVAILFVIVAIIIVASTIMAEEYSKGTIKQLLIKPYSRGKILLSKYITCLMVFGIFVLFYFILSVVAYGFVGSYSDYLNPIVVYDFVSSSIKEYNLIAYCLLHLLALLPQYLIILSLSFFASTIVANTSVAMIISFISYFAGNIINVLIEANNIKYLAWFPTMCWDLTSYLFGGISSFQYSSLGLSITVSLIVLLVLIIISFGLFKKKDIKNI